MPRSLDADFITEKNAETNAPIWLYRVETTDSRANDLYIAEYHENVTFDGQEYSAGTDPNGSGISHDGVSERRDGTIEQLTITVSNINRNFQSFLEKNDALRGRKVTITQVFFAHIDGEVGADTDAFIRDEYFIDSAISTETIVAFTLTGKVNVLQITVPRRKYARRHCQFGYKIEGCFEENSSGGFSAPVGFVADPSGPTGDACNKTLEQCAEHNNKSRFGGFPGVPSKHVFIFR